MYAPSYPMKTKSKSSRMAASCTSKDKSCNRGGCTDCGASDARGGIETLDANGAVVYGTIVASGCHGAVFAITSADNSDKVHRVFALTLQ